jgi:5-aminopentanamidase
VARPVRVVCAQLAPRVGEHAANVAASVRAVRDAVAAGADVVVLPELVTSGYVFDSAGEAAGLAVTPADPLFGRWAEAAGGAVVVGGFCEAGPAGLLHNSAALVAGGAVRAVYRKTHLWDREKLVFTPGDAPPPVLDTAVGRVGVLICYDLEFPELTRSLVLAGAELLVAPVNWPLAPRPAGERAPEVLNAMNVARLNRVAVACCDRAGTERGVHWTEGTTIVDEQGWVAAAAGPGEGVAGAVLDLELSRDKRISPRNDLLADRRPELYGAVARPAG